MHVAKDAHPHSNVLFPAMAIKGAMQTAALVTEGIKKTEVQRLVFLPDEMIPIFGVPKLRMGVMRSADIARTPDVRTRAYFPEWATQLEIRFSTPSLSKKGIISLLHNAGLMVGIGDERQEKGKGSAGTFSVGTDDVPAALLDRNAQWEAIQTPIPFDADSEELLAAFDAEVEARA